MARASPVVEAAVAILGEPAQVLGSGAVSPQLPPHYALPPMLHPEDEQAKRIYSELSMPLDSLKLEGKEWFSSKCTAATAVLDMPNTSYVLCVGCVVSFC